MSAPTATEVALAALRIAEASPEFVYAEPNCVYTKNGKGSCLIGQAFEALGRPIGEDSGWNSRAAFNLPESLIKHGELTPAVDGAQAAQDQREPWSACAGILRDALTEAGAL